MNNIKIERDVNGKVVRGIVSKTFLKKADIFGTNEYAEMQSFYEMHPGATIKAKTIKTKPDKRTTKNYTYENMELYIKATKGEKVNEFLEEMNTIKNVSQIQKRPYKYVLDWFKETFPEHTTYDIFTKSDDKNIEQSENGEKTNKVIPLKEVANN